MCNNSILFFFFFFRFLQFGRCQCSQYLVSCTSSCVNVWDLVTCSVSWSVDLRVTALVADPVSEVMAVFTDNKDSKLIENRFGGYKRI